uniref:Uncharacterized protein n=1 Tax=Panagrolaimus sp. JU765 TaxID=591449 RepID=A0AC34QMI3_9BILA
MTYVDRNLFEIEMFEFGFASFIVDQVMIKNNKRVLEVKLMNMDEFPFDPTDERFTVTSASSSGQIIFSYTFTDSKPGSIIENIDENDWIKINFEKTKFCVHYSNQLLNAWFPRKEYETPLERINKIKSILDCKIELIEPEMLVNTIENEFWE